MGMAPRSSHAGSVKMSSPKQNWPYGEGNVVRCTPQTGDNTYRKERTATLRCITIDMKTGHIISIISNQYLVCMDSGEQVVCVAMGKLRKGRSPIVGDRVVVERFESQSGIQRILPPP